MKRGRHPGSTTPRQGSGGGAALEVGRIVRDNDTQRTGTVVDVACQYAHPKADPAYNYLIRWDDGQIQAYSATALEGPFGIEPVD